MATLYIAEEHDQVFHYWRRTQAKGLSVAHVDFHCDLRGMLIDRQRQRAFSVSAAERRYVDPGNFLGHAVMEGMVSELDWIHAPHGGRRFDDGPVVKYETDLAAKLPRTLQMLRPQPEYDIKFKELLLQNWAGPRHGQQLDLDWDALASREFTQAESDRLITQFLNLPFAHPPAVSFLVYSPDYAIEDRAAFQNFGHTLAAKLGAELQELPAMPAATPAAVTGLKQRLKQFAPSQLKAAKRRLSTRWRDYETRHDLPIHS